MNKINFLDTKNFYSFKINNFLSKELYEEIDSNFPDLYELLDKKNALNNRTNGKYVINKKSKIYQELITEKKVFRDFFKQIESKRFFFEIYDQIFTRIILSKISNIKDTVKLLRFSKFSSERNKLEKLIYKNLKINHEISFLTNEAFLEPHTDSRSKLCSIMIYFPTKIKLNTIDKEKEKKIGTQFWESKINNYNNYDYKYFNNIFQNKSYRGIKTNFEKYNAYGFLKNSYSWHSVDKIDVNKEYVRRSINISLNYY